MKVRRGKFILWALVALVAVVLLRATWIGYRFFYPARGTPPALKVAALLKANDPGRMLAEANRYYWTHNLPAASPLYEQAEKLFEQSHLLLQFVHEGDRLLILAGKERGEFAELRARF